MEAQVPTAEPRRGGADGATRAGSAANARTRELRAKWRRPAPNAHASHPVDTVMYANRRFFDPTRTR